MSRPWGALLLALYAAGWALVIGATFMIDHFELFGLRQGVRSREVAGRLSVSVRTVDNQLASVYSKLGIARRSELRAALVNTL